MDGKPPLIELSEVVAGYGQTVVLHGIDARVGEGEVVALLGANGAGKTTTLRVISGSVHPRSGTVRFKGQPLHRHNPRSATRSGIAHCPEGRRIFPGLSVRENLEMGAAILPNVADRRAAVDEMLELFPRLKERERQAGGTLSGGEQQMLAVGRALASRPSVLMLDEPSLGLAPIVVDQIAHLIRDLKGRGMTILLVEQNAALALTLADQAYILESGSVALSGSASDLANDARVRDAYLGSGTFVRRRKRGTGRPAVENPSADTE